MKDFQLFRNTLTKETLDQWHREIDSELTAALNEQFPDDPLAWRNAYDRSYSLKLTLKLLEAYHEWLHH